MRATRVVIQFALAVALSVAYIIDWSGFAEHRPDPVALVPIVNAASDRIEAGSDQRTTVERPLPGPREAELDQPATVERPHRGPRDMVVDPPRSAPPGLHPMSGQKVFRLAIPRISLKQAVVEGATTQVLAQGVGHYPSCGPGFPPPYCSPFEEVWPGERGRVIIAGHRTIPPRPFFNLDEVRRGDEIFTIARWGTFRYLVTSKRVVAPTDRTVIVDGVRGRELALVTCHPRFSARQRLIVYARLHSPEAPTESLRHPLR